MGEVRVPADRLWGAQTQRSLENFRIGTERMPREIHEALLLIKRAAVAYFPIAHKSESQNARKIDESQERNHMMVSLEKIRADMQRLLERDKMLHNVDVNAESIDEALADAAVQLDSLDRKSDV